MISQGTRTIFSSLSFFMINFLNSSLIVIHDDRTHCFTMMVYGNKVLLQFPLAALTLTLISVSTASDSTESNPTRIAIIGGGISGSFATKYLSDYDVDCSLDITVFDPPSSKGNQGSRVASHALEDGTVVEMGASILFGENKLVNDMIAGSVGMVDDDGNDETLRKTKPHTGGVNSNDPEIRNGIGVYDGRSDDIKKPTFPLLLSNMTDEEQTSHMMWRYNLDLWRVHTATKAALESFEVIYDYLDNNDDESTFFDSPNDIWEAVGLSHEASVSFEEYLQGIGVAPSVSWWKRLLATYMRLGHQGSVQSELLEPINIYNNNQINSQMTGLAGLVNSAAAMGNWFAVEGGNDKLISSAFQQAAKNHEKACSGKHDASTIKRLPIEIRTLLSSDFQRTIELFNEDGKLVDLKPYDIVVVATPLQFSGIEFMGKGSVFDDGVLYYLPLNEMVNSEKSDANLHEHIHSLGGDFHLPSSAKRPYAQVVTTYVANGTLEPSFFQMDDDNERDRDLPRSILFTENGRNQTGISSISQITRDVYKVFSSSELSQQTIQEIFGKNAHIEYTKVWGGSKGGATPAFHGAGEASRSTQFLLYNGGRQEDDGDGDYGSSSNANTHQHGIYYTNAMESAVSAIEIAAIGSKSVAKLIARRLGLVNPRSSNTNGDEL